MNPRGRVVIGYHGCDRGLAIKLINGDQAMKANDKSYHWLGSGVYFWEDDKERAFEWAEEKASRSELETPFVLGAVIDLGRCLDLSVRQNVPLVEEAHKSLAALFQQSGNPMPVNRPAPKDPRPDKVMRFLDCAVLNHLVERSDEPIDTVRGLFVEGAAIYEGGEIYNKTHVEIAVRNMECIRGLFIPRH